MWDQMPSCLSNAIASDLTRQPQRHLHHARQARRRKLAEACVDLRAGSVKPRGVVHRRKLRVVEEVVNLPTELQFSLLAEEGKVLEEGLIPVVNAGQAG
jgi:hypothetical protein